MSYSRRQLYAMGEPLGDGATRREVGGKIIYGTGGGGGGTPERQTTIVDIPDYAKPYAKESLGKAAALTSSPYQTYGGERIAQFSPLQKQAFGRAEGQQVADQIGFGSGLAGLSGISSFQNPGTAQGFMSPYMDAVTQRQMDSAQRQADIASTQRGAQAVRAGAFGGSRQAIENAEAARALASQKGQIQETGLQSAFDRAQQQFNAEQSQRLNAAQTLGQLGQQQFGQQMDITGQQAQFGQQQRAATQDILSAQYQDFLNQQRAPFDNLAFMSSILRGTPMGQTTTMYQPPPSQTSQLIGLGTAAAGAYGAYQGNKAAGGEVNSYAAGGGISALNQPQMAAMAGGMSDEQLNEAGQMPSITELAEMTLKAEAQQRADTRARALAQQAMMQQQPQTTVAEEQMAALGGISNLEAPNLEGMGEATMADGGIVAFENGGYLPPLERYSQRKFAEEERRRLEFEAFNEQLRNDPAQVQMREMREAEQEFANMTPFEKSSERGRRIKEFLRAVMSAPAAAGPGILPNLEPPSVAPSPTPAAQPTAGLDAAIMADEARKRAPGQAANQAIIEQAAAAEQQNTVAAPAAPLPGLSSLQAQTAAGLTGLETQMGDINAARTAAAANQLERGKAQEAEMGEFGTEQEKRLQERAEGIKGSEGKNFNMALIEAGLAMMAGTSANAFENIGKGALVGTKAYTTGIERIQNRKEKLDDAMTALENAKRSDKRVSQERMDRLEANVDNAAIANADAMYQFGKDRLGMTREDTKLATEMAMEQKKLDTSVQIAGMRRDKEDTGTDFTKAYLDFIKPYAGKVDALNKPIPVPTMEEYLQSLGIFGQAPKGAQVLPPVK